MKRLYFVLLVVFLVLLLGGCFSMFDILNGTWEGVINGYDTTIIVNWSDMATLHHYDGSFTQQHVMSIRERTPNRGFLANYEKWDYGWKGIFVEVTLENPITVLVIFYKDVNGEKGDLMYQGYLYKQI